MNAYKFDVQKSMKEAFNMNTKLMSGLRNMMEMDEVEFAKTPKEVVYTEDRMQIYHYKPAVSKPHATPVLVVYALVNKQYMLDLQENRSIVKEWLNAGLDVYMIDWGYPNQVDKFLDMEDYVDGYINNAVDFVSERHKQKPVNLIGICQGGTLSVIYSALYPHKVKNLVTMVTPFDFSTNDGLLFRWSKFMDIDAMVDAEGGLYKGSHLNFGFNMLKPFSLSFNKYIHFIDKLDDKDALMDFLRMETWIYDSPAQAGVMLKRFVKDLYIGNKLAKNELVVGGRKAEIKNITMPTLCMLAQKDHLVPPASTRPFIDAIPCEDKTLLEYPVGHIGMFVSSKAQNDIGPSVAKWLKKR